MQFFGARANLAKSLLYAINGGVDEKKSVQVVPDIPLDQDEVLDYPKVLGNYKKVLSYVAELYVDTINIIHYMHDKYAYESSQMALHDTLVERLAAFGVAGLSIAADSLSAIKFAKVKPIRMRTASPWTLKWRGTSPSTATTTTGWTTSLWSWCPTSLPS